MDSLNFCTTHKGLLVYRFVVMTNHLHLIVQAKNGNLSGIVRDFKKFTSVSMLHAINSEPESRREWLLHRFNWNASTNQRSSNYQLWTHENHAVLIDSLDIFNKTLAYIHQNPVRAGWVEQPEHYIYSSANKNEQTEKARVQLAEWYY